MSWFSKGNDPSRQDILNRGKESSTWRFFVKKGETREIVFLDDPDLYISEYSFKVRDEFKNYTCSGEGCPALAQGFKPYPAALFTVLDLTPWTDKKGDHHKYTKKVLVVKGQKMMELISAQRQIAGGSLVGVKMKMIRTTAEKSSNIGDSFSISGKVKLESIPEKDRQPIDYMKEFAPPSEEKMIQILKFAAPPTGGKKTATISRDAFQEEPFQSQDLGGGEPSFDENSEIPF